jgi:thiamine-monophosphate kinase
LEKRQSDNYFISRLLENFQPMNERDIINLLHGHQSPCKKRLVRGTGDDCAVIRKDNDRLWLVTMDTLVESVHFNLSWHPPEKLGRKSVAVNVSDIAAMGGFPCFVFLSLGLPPGFDTAWLDGFSRGLSEACSEYECFLAGGDTVRSPDGVLLTLTVIGEVETDRILYRNGALPGDGIWVSGTPGSAAAGLELCRAGLMTGAEDLVEHHLNPQARLPLGRLLAQSRLVNAMIDLSDGLATDLAHICRESSTGAVIYSDLLPGGEALKNAARLLSMDHLQWMLEGGEDYELVFTVPEEHGGRVVELAEKIKLPLTRIGTIDEKSGVRLIRGRPGRQKTAEEDISFVGFDHFS